MARIAHWHRFRNLSPKALNNVQSKLRVTAKNPVILLIASTHGLSAVVHAPPSEEFF